MPALDNLLVALSVFGQLLLLGILIQRRLYRIFPVFTAYMLWQVTSDVVLRVALHSNHGIIDRFYYDAYYYFLALADALEIGVLVEIAAIVVRPAKRILQRKILGSLIVLIVLAGFAAFVIAIFATQAINRAHVALLLDTTAAFLRLAVFLLIAVFSQMLGLTWRHHVLQLATGLGFFAIVVLMSQIFQSHVHIGSTYDIAYHRWGQIEAIGYLCAVYFWCWAFWKKEAPRRDFSPQMAKFLVSISGSAKRQNAVLARSRDE